MNPRAILEGIRAANYHKPGIRCLRLFNVEVAGLRDLRADVDRLMRTERGSKVTGANHITNWIKPQGEVVQFSLLNASGCYDDFRDDHNLSCFGKRFRAGNTYPALARLIEALPHTVNIRINLLGPGAALSPHKEHSVIRTRAGSVALRTRFHLPLFSNLAAELMLEGEIYRLEVGTVYFVNHGCVHSARNAGTQDRIHLVWDMLLTCEAFQFMFEEIAPGYPLKRVKESEWEMRPVRSETVGTYERIAPLVSEDQANLISWCQVQ